MQRAAVRYQPDHKDEARAKLLQAVGRGFRRQGYGGIGVDGLAKEAGVTSGAFYGHFKSKDAAFAEAATAALEQLRDGVAALQADRGEKWADAFIDFYLSERLRCDLDESCGLQSLTPDVMRASEATKARYEAILSEVAEQIAHGLADKSRDVRLQKAWGLMALLSGGVTMARSMKTQGLQQRVAGQLKRAARAYLAND
jgi:TetR/AcrR family transcriptional repressor of nem operon